MYNTIVFFVYCLIYYILFELSIIIFFYLWDWFTVTLIFGYYKTLIITYDCRYTIVSCERPWSERNSVLASIVAMATNCKYNYRTRPGRFPPQPYFHDKNPIHRTLVTTPSRCWHDLRKSPILTVFVVYFTLNTVYIIYNAICNNTSDIFTLFIPRYDPMPSGVRLTNRSYMQFFVYKISAQYVYVSIL